MGGARGKVYVASQQFISCGAGAAAHGHGHAWLASRVHASATICTVEILYILVFYAPFGIKVGEFTEICDPPSAFAQA